MRKDRCGRNAGKCDIWSGPHCLQRCMYKPSLGTQAHHYLLKNRPVATIPSNRFNMLATLNQLKSQKYIQDDSFSTKEHKFLEDIVPGISLYSRGTKVGKMLTLEPQMYTAGFCIAAKCIWSNCTKHSIFYGSPARTRENIFFHNTIYFYQKRSGLKILGLSV